MEGKHLIGLMEAYSEVYAPQEEIEEAVKGEPLERRKYLAAERRSGHRPLPAKEGEKYASYKLAQMAYVNRQRMEEEVEQVDEAITSKKGKEKAAEMIANRSTPSGRAKPGQGASVAAINHIIRANVDNLGGTPPNPKIAKNPVKSRSYGGTGNASARRAGLTPTREKPNAWKEEVDIFDVVLEFLQVEGYAETLEEAEWMMSNVIDEEAIDIILGEEQLTSRNEAFEAWLEEAVGRVFNTNTPYGMHRTVVTPTGTRSTLNGRELPAERQRDPKAEVSSKRGSKPTTPTKKISSMKEAFNIFVNTLINEGMNLDRYSWDDLHYAFDEIFSESSQANRDPDAYERNQRQSETRGQSAERRVRDRLSTMDPDKRAKMIAQMRAVGLNV